MRDVKYNSVRDAAPPTIFVPYTQTRFGNAAFEVRTRERPGGRDRRGPRGGAADRSRTCR